MKSEHFEIVALKSGQQSLRMQGNQETFHPVIGPVAEAAILHVDQQRLRERALAAGRLLIWDVGLGAAANAITAIEALLEIPAAIEIHSFDRSLVPLHFALEHAEALSYIAPHTDAVRTLMREKRVQLGSILWHLHEGDFRQSLEQELPTPDAVFYDPYSAASNPEMWTLEHFQKLRQAIGDVRSCLLTNYTRSTAIRSTLLLAGFYVGIGVGIGEKEQTTVASNQLETLDRPLSQAWLKQVQASQNANPLREEGSAYGPMSAADFAVLSQHPQFVR